MWKKLNVNHVEMNDEDRQKAEKRLWFIPRDWSHVPSPPVISSLTHRTSDLFFFLFFLTKIFLFLINILSGPLYAPLPRQLHLTWIYFFLFFIYNLAPKFFIIFFKAFKLQIYPSSSSIHRKFKHIHIYMLDTKLLDTKLKIASLLQKKTKVEKYNKYYWKFYKKNKYKPRSSNSQLGFLK